MLVQNPAISVILPAFNAEKHVEQAIVSILSQTFNNLELILIDDGSTDRTPEILSKNTDPRIRVLSNANNLGLPTSLNKGISIARGRYIARQDADDFSLPERLQKQYDYMEKHMEVALLGTSRKTISSSGKMKLNKPPIESPSFKDMCKGNCIIASSVLIRKECLETVGGYDDFFRQADDYDLWLRLSKKYPIANLQEALCVVRTNADSLSRKNKDTQVLFRLLAKNRAVGTVDDKTFSEIKKQGIKSYQQQLSPQDEIFFHQRVAKKCMRYGHNNMALEHYQRLTKLQGFNLKVAYNMLHLKLRLLGTQTHKYKPTQT